MRAKKSLWLVVLMMLFAGSGACADPAPLDDALLVDFERDKLKVVTANGREHELRLYMAQTPDQWTQGLMMVRSLPDDVGMLFVYPRDKPGSMWMKDTLLSLDILFIRRDGTIANITHDTTPRSLKSIKSEGDIRAALELKAGTAADLGIEPGDRIIHAAFTRPPTPD